MSFEPREYLRHIAIESDYLIAETVAVSYEEFLQNGTLQRAFIRSLEIIGEASKKLPESFRAEHPEVEWRQMSGMRDRLIHGYLSVDYEIVWDVLMTRIPVLRRQVAAILGE